jgi:hypothetical protein
MMTGASFCGVSRPRRCTVSRWVVVKSRFSMYVCMPGRLVWLPVKKLNLPFMQFVSQALLFINHLHVPAAAGDPFKVVEPADAQLLMTLRVAGRGVQAAAVRSLSYLAGCGSSGGDASSGGGGSDDCLLVFGGQGEGEPDMLTLLPLAAQPAGEGGGRLVPWFGSIKGVCMVSE